MANGENTVRLTDKTPSKYRQNRVFFFIGTLSIIDCFAEVFPNFFCSRFSGNGETGRVRQKIRVRILHKEIIGRKLFFKEFSRPASSNSVFNRPPHAVVAKSSLFRGGFQSFRGNLHSNDPNGINFQNLWHSWFFTGYFYVQRRYETSPSGKRRLVHRLIGRSPS